MLISGDWTMSDIHKRTKTMWDKDLSFIMGDGMRGNQGKCSISCERRARMRCQIVCVLRSPGNAGTGHLGMIRQSPDQLLLTLQASAADMSLLVRNLFWSSDQVWPPPPFTAAPASPCSTFVFIVGLSMDCQLGEQILSWLCPRLSTVPGPQLGLSACDCFMNEQEGGSSA